MYVATPPPLCSATALSTLFCELNGGTQLLAKPYSSIYNIIAEDGGAHTHYIHEKRAVPVCTLTPDHLRVVQPSGDCGL